MNHYSRSHILFFYFLFVAGIALYFQSLTNDIINWSDEELFSFVSAFLHGKGNLFSQARYTPVSLLWFSFQRSFSEYGYFLFHTVSLIFHIINAALFFLLCRRKFDMKISSFLSLLFLVHPVMLESVAWVSRQSALIGAFFLLAALHAYILFKEKGKKRYFLAAVVSVIAYFLFALPGAAIILLIILVDYQFTKEKIKILVKRNSLFIGIYLFFLFAYIFQAGAVSNIIQSFSDLNISVLRFGIVRNIAELFVPFAFPLVTDSEIFISHTSVISWLYPAISGVIFLAAILLRRKNSLIAISVLFFLLTAMPIVTFMTDEKTLLSNASFYLSSPSLLFLFGLFLQRIAEKISSLKIIVIAGYAVLFAVLCSVSYVTVKRSMFWKNNETFWNAAHADDPHNQFVLLQRGNYNLDRYEIDKALVDFDTLLSYSPENEEALVSRGLAYLRSYNYPQAINDLTAAITFKRANFTAYYNLGITYDRIMQHDSAIAVFSRSLEFFPNSAQLLTARGNAFISAGKAVEAFADFQRAVTLDSVYTNAYRSRASASMQLGNFTAARKDFEKEIEINPRQFIPYVNLAFCSFLLDDTLSVHHYYSTAYNIDSIGVKSYTGRAIGTFLRSRSNIQSFNRIINEIERK